MYGPPPSPQQINLNFSQGTLLVCIVLGLGISCLALSKRFRPATRAWLFCFGQCVVLTAPLALVLPDAVYGDFPTIDKAGSLFYYQDGVHERFLFHPFQSLNDCGVQLIGVHMGHLWITAFFDSFLPSHGAFNAQALVYPALGWWTAALFFKQIGSRWDNAILFGLPFGLGLHLFRDLNWYTIEKAAIFLLPLFAYGLHRAHKEGGRWLGYTGLIFLGTAFINWYLALVAAAGAGVALLASRSRPLLKALGMCILFSLPLLVLQLLLVSKGSPGTPEMYLNERAALDHFSLVPLEWNRLEFLNALHPLALVLLVLGWWRSKRDGLDWVLISVGAALFVFSLGPRLPGDVSNPVYMLAWKFFPGFWRVAKPEVFFYGTWLCLLAVTARSWADYSLRWLYPLMVLGWLFWVRSHPAFPQFSAPIERTPDLCKNPPEPPGDDEDRVTSP